MDPQASLAAPARELDHFDPDNQRFLRNIQQRGRQVMIAEGLTRAQRDFDAFLEEKVDMDWEDQRQKIFHHFGLSQKDATGAGGLKSTTRGAFGRSARQSKQTGAAPVNGPSAASRRSVFGRSGLEKSVIGTPGAGLASRQIFEDPAERNEGTAAHSPDLRFQREKMGHYAEKVQQLNLARLQGKCYPVLDEFSYVEIQAGGDVSFKTSRDMDVRAANHFSGTSATLQCIPSLDKNCPREAEHHEPIGARSSEGATVCRRLP